MNNKLRKAIVISLTGTAMALTPVLSSASTISFGGSTTGSLQAQSWNGANNGYAGWGHNSDWYSFKVSSKGNVDIKVVGDGSGVQPAFTLWSSGTSEYSTAPWSHAYSQIKNTPIPGTSFVGFANNSTDPHFGTGPANLGLGGAAALAGTSAMIGTTAMGKHFAELIFPNASANTWYFVAVGGSGGSSGAYTLSTATASPVPLPAAVWLFGSALAGLTAVGRRKSAVNA